ncbi:MAG: polyamine aminopropyltransferase [Methanosarcinales archaeon]
MNNIKFFDKYTPNTTYLSIEVKDVIYSKSSKYQKIYILDTEDFGKILVLDESIQTTEMDEFHYHEMIVHVPLLTHPNPKKILIIGGGDGGCCKEVLKHNPEKVVCVEIDEEVVKSCEKYMPMIGENSFSNQSVELKIDDGIKFVEYDNNKFDVIIIDSTDPVEIAEGLFSKEFYSKIYSKLEKDGIMVCQSESPFFHFETLKKVRNYLNDIFPIVKTYLSYIPTYPSGMWSFTLASKKYNPLIPEEIINKRLKERKINSKYYNAEIHNSAFSIPEWIKHEIIT